MGYEDDINMMHSKGILEIAGNLSLKLQEFTATGTPTATVATGLITFAHTVTPVLLTIPAPRDSGQLLILRNTSASGVIEHVMTSVSGTTFDGTNDTATFDAPGEQLILMSISTTQWIILLNSGSVAMSSVA